MNTELEVNEMQPANKLVITRTLIGEADDLAKEHEDFQDRYIVAGRQALYELIGKIYFLAEKLDGCIDRVEQLELLRNILLKEYGVKTQQNTPDLTVLVRYITRADRKTAHVYARAIEAARANQVPPTNFAGYVKQVGGLERIRSGTSASLENLCDEIVDNKTDDMLELTKLYLSARSELPLATFKLSKKMMQGNKNGSFTHFFCHERNGRQYVLAQLSVDKKHELGMIQDVARQLSVDVDLGKKNINRFYAKAMKKRRQRTIKEICKRRPVLAAVMKKRCIGI